MQWSLSGCVAYLAVWGWESALEWGLEGGKKHRKKKTRKTPKKQGKKHPKNKENSDNQKTRKTKKTRKGRSGFGDSQKCPGERPKLGVPQGVLPRVPFFILSQGKALWERSLGHSQFSGHSRGHSPGHCLGVPKKHSESTRRSTFADSPESTPVNGRRDRNTRNQFCPS